MNECWLCFQLTAFSLLLLWHWLWLFGPLESRKHMYHNSLPCFILHQLPISFHFVSTRLVLFRFGVVSFRLVYLYLAAAWKHKYSTRRTTTFSLAKGWNTHCRIVSGLLGILLCSIWWGTHYTNAHKAITIDLPLINPENGLMVNAAYA